MSAEELARVEQAVHNQYISGSVFQRKPGVPDDARMDKISDAAKVRPGIL